MLLPNRHGSTDSYRYGFQGQEKDDEIKGEGNSLNYTFRMHDPRIGRFFATDPLEAKYPELTPYQFSSNRVIQFVELEGLEGAPAGTSYVAQQLYMEGKITQDELFKVYEIRGKGAAIGVIGSADVMFNQGRITKFLFKQYLTQLTVNTAVDGVAYLLAGETFDPVKIVEESFTGLDFADFGIDKATEMVLDKYKVGKIQKAIKVVAPSLFDITIEEGIQVVGINKEAEKIVTDIIGNILNEGVEKIVGDKLPTIKLSSVKKADEIAEFILDTFKSTLSGVTQETINDLDVDIEEDFNNKSESDLRDLMKKKKDNTRVKAPTILKKIKKKNTQLPKKEQPTITQGRN